MMTRQEEHGNHAHRHGHGPQVRAYHVARLPSVSPGRPGRPDEASSQAIGTKAARRPSSSAVRQAARHRRSC
jgi:hypothetical protein